MSDLEDLSYGELLDRLRKDLQLDASVDILAGSLMQALIPGTRLKVLQDAAGNAPFLRLPAVANLQCQVGMATAQPIVANGNTSVSVLLPVAWPHNHLAFGVIGTHYSGSLTGVAVAQSGPYAAGGAYSLDHGTVVFVNGPTAQNVDWWWVSFGN